MWTQNQMPLIGQNPDEINQRMEEISVEETGKVLPVLDRIAGGRPLSNILMPGEESLNIIRVQDAITNGATKYIQGLPGTETVIDSQIPANLLIISCPSIIQFESLILYVSLGADIKVNTSGGNTVYWVPQNTDFMISAASTANNTVYSDTIITIPLPRKRHKISYCWGWGTTNFGATLFASFIFINKETR